MWIGVTFRVKPLTWGHESSSGLPKIWGVTKIVCNKEVQWSSFYFDWAQNGSNGFGSYSDFFSEMEVSVGNFARKVEEILNNEARDNKSWKQGRD